MKCHKNVITPLPSLAHPGSSSQTAPPPPPNTLCKHIQTHTHLHVGGVRFEERGVGGGGGGAGGVEGWGGFQLVVFSLWVPVSAWSSRVAHNNPITVVVTDGPKAAPGGCSISGTTFGLDFNRKRSGSFWGADGPRHTACRATSSARSSTAPDGRPPDCV